MPGADRPAPEPPPGAGRPDPAEVPSDWEAISPRWMSAALQRDHPGAEVRQVSVLSRDDGTNRRGRLGLTYDRGTGPAVVFVKGEGAWRESHAANGNLFNEPELFASRIPLPVDHPHAYHVVMDHAGLDYLIVMEDLTRRGADPRDATRPIRPSQVEDGVRRLAALHGAYWDLPASPPGLGWLQTWQATEGWRRSLGPGIPVGAARAVDLLPAGVAARSSDEILSLCMRAMAAFGSGRLTLLHADPHIGNTYLLPGGEVGFLDWQVCRRGSWAMDLAYFVVSALTVEDRRDAEESLLAAYRDALAVALPAGSVPGAGEVRTRFAAAHPYGLAVWLATHQSDRSQTPEVCRELIIRFAAAFVDGSSEAALDRLTA
ncbi:MAG TPA: phosphotransferase [Acidimicrobiales bacterium]|nr:phosphotransferase [Acidimicrobiales bacterium]